MDLVPLLPLRSVRLRSHWVLHAEFRGQELFSVRQAFRALSGVDECLPPVSVARAGIPEAMLVLMRQLFLPLFDLYPRDFGLDLSGQSIYMAGNYSVPAYWRAQACVDPGTSSESSHATAEGEKPTWQGGRCDHAFELT